MKRGKRRVLVVVGVSILLTTAGVVGGLAVGVWRYPHAVPFLWRIPYTSWEVGGAGVDPEALAGMQWIRLRLKARYHIRSGYRSPRHNRSVGGASGSQHTYGRAFDLRVPMHLRDSFYDEAKRQGFTGFGWGSSTVHIDTGARRWWTYDNAGRAMSGEAKHRYLYKAPENFKRDYGLHVP